MSNKPLIVVYVNKHFEVEPLTSALMALNRSYGIIPPPTKLATPKTVVNRLDEPRVSYRSENLKIDIDIWCIEDLMATDVNASSSEAKYNVLPTHIKEQNPNFVISVSTSETTPKIQSKANNSYNGSVLMGGNFYLFDAGDFDSSSPSHLKIPISLYNNNVKEELFEAANKIPTNEFYEQLNVPANPEIICAKSNFTSIGVVNVVDYSIYSKADPAAYQSFISQYGLDEYFPTTIETTHGIVKMSVESVFPQNILPTLFVSPITDQYEHFQDQVGNSGLQNYIAGYNGGIAVGKLLLAINNDPTLI